MNAYIFFLASGRGRTWGQLLFSGKSYDTVELQNFRSINEVLKMSSTMLIIETINIHKGAYPIIKEYLQ